MTSNLGSSVIQELAGEDNYAEMKDAVMEIVGQHFRPEFINRVDEAVVFHPLGQNQIRAICKIQIELLRRRLQEKTLAWPSANRPWIYWAKPDSTRYTARGR